MKRILPIFLFAILTQTAVSQDAVYDRNTDTTTPRKVIRLKKYSYDDPQLNRIAAIEILPRHDENIARVLHLLLKASVDQGLPLLESNPATTSKEEIKAAQLAALRMPVLDEETHAEGVYMSYEEFKANKPSVTAPFRAEKSRRKLTLYTLDVDNNKVPISHAWGFCSRNELYKLDGNNIVPLEKSGNGFIISRYLQYAQRRNKAIFMSALLGGAAGAVIASGATQISVVTAIPYIMKQQPEATALDMITGDLTL